MVPPQRAALVTSALWAGTVVTALVSAILTFVAWQDMVPSDAYPNLGASFAAVLYATLGATIVRRVQNPIGWMLLDVGLLLAVMCLTSAYAITGVLAHPGLLPAAKLVGAMSEWTFIPVFIGVAYVLLLFPTGTLPSPKWRAVAIAGVAPAPFILAAYVVAPRTVMLPAPGGTSLTFENPLAVTALRGGAAGLGSIQTLAVWYVLLLGLAFVATIVRYRSGGVDTRQQIKWVALVAVAGAALQLAGLLTAASPGLSIGLLLAEAAVALIGVPAAITIAILKYRLYDIDVIINRTVVYGLLASAVTAVYVILVVGIGATAGYGVHNPLLTTVAAVAIALLVQPLRRQAQRAANRLVYGDRATPYQVLSDFAENMAGTLAVDDILERMVSVLADGTGAVRADVWIRIGPKLQPAATWPRGAAAPAALAMGAGEELYTWPAATRAMAVRHGAELLGVLALQKPRNEPLTPTEDKLLQHLASQAGLVLRNVRLTAELRGTIEELRASRRRLVEAEDTERRKIERNLHDGAQQQLVALKVHLGLLDAVAGDVEQVKGVAHRLRDAAQQALDDLRDLARGIYPPLLADRGLVAALQRQARRLTTETTVECDGVGRYAQEVEAAVYFCALEALQNVAKYADATSTVIRLSATDGHLVFEIDDDGRGFEPAETGYGTGLRGMADRLDALGGSLDVTSEPRRGTVVRGMIRIESPASQTTNGRLETHDAPPTPPKILT
jgi:signal transduction histidine kinase